MKWSQLSIPTLRDNPAGPLSAAHKLLIRAGYWRQEDGFLDLGVRAIENIRRIACSEMGQTEPQRRGTWLRFEAAPDSLERVNRVLVRCGLPETPAIRTEPASVDPEGDLDPEPFETPDCGTIDEVAAFTGLPPTAQMKSLVMVADGMPVLVLVRGDHHLARPKLGLILDSRDIRPATVPQIQEWFGADPGSLGPVGITRLPILADSALTGRRNMICGANRTGFHLRNVTPGEDFQVEFYALRDGASEGPLRTAEAFYIGSAATGIDPFALLRDVVAASADPDGLVLPPAVAPFTVVVTPVNNADQSLREAALAIHNECEQLGLSPLYDDRDDRPGVKFKDADLIGVPRRVTIGGKKLAQGLVELTERRTHSARDVHMPEVARTVFEEIRAHL